MTSRSVLSEIASERQRQIAAEGWSPARDDKEHANGQLALAAAAYAFAGSVHGDARTWLKLDNPLSMLRNLWPRGWWWGWWKPSHPRRDLIKAAALIVAEIERLDRAAEVAPEARSDTSRSVGEVGHEQAAQAAAPPPEQEA